MNDPKAIGKMRSRAPASSERKNNPAASVITGTNPIRRYSALFDLAHIRARRSRCAGVSD
jgi:hypothetical protein